MTIPHRRVVIVRDTCSPLWVIRCERPCTPAGWCQTRPDGGRICWLGSGSTTEVAANLAKRVGYTVETCPAQPQGSAPAAAGAAAGG